MKNMMTTTLQRMGCFACFGLGLLVCRSSFAAAPADSLTWHQAENRVDADVHDWPLPKLLEEIAAATGWLVYVAPDAEAVASTRFKNLPVADALRRLLGNLNFALVPETNGNPRLLVYKISLHEATKLVAAPLVPKVAKTPAAKPIPDELIVRLKPGAKIDDLARQLGAKVIGRIDSLNAYRLKFDNAGDAESARDTLGSNSDVASVDSNYAIDRPTSPQPLLASSVPPLNLQVKAPGPNGRIVVGLIDTPVQPLGGGLDAFLQQSIPIAGDAKPNPNFPTHATSMAETLLTSLQAVTGGSTSVQILPVDVYGNNTSTSTFDVALGVTKAVNAGANPINLSLGSDADSPFLHDVIKQASQQGIVFFAAAGNEPVTTPVYPAAYPEVTGVTAGDRQGNIASYANRGSFVKIIAPGSSVIYFQNQPFYVTGTSASAAYASGMAAGLAETQHKSLSQADATLQQNLGVKPAGSR